MLLTLTVLSLRRCDSESYCVLSKKSYCESLWMRAPGLHDIHWYVHNLFKMFIDMHVQFPKCPNPWSFPCIKSTERSVMVVVFSPPVGDLSPAGSSWTVNKPPVFVDSNLKINNELIMFNHMSVILLSKIYWVDNVQFLPHVLIIDIIDDLNQRSPLNIPSFFQCPKTPTYRWSRCSPPSTPCGPRDSAALPQSSPLVWDMDKLSEYIYISLFVSFRPSYPVLCTLSKC